MLEGDPRPDAEADADWRRAMERLLPSSIPPPLPAWRQAQVDALSTPPLSPPPWPAPAWGSTAHPEPSHEPDSYRAHRNGRRKVMIHESPSTLIVRIRALPRLTNLSPCKPPCLPSAAAPLPTPSVWCGIPAYRILSLCDRSSSA